jgi:hypothetical protein
MPPNLRAITGSLVGKPATSVPGQYTTDPTVMPDRATLDKIADIARARTARAAKYAADSLAARGLNPEEEDEYRLIAEIRDRKSMLESEQARLRALFRRLDNLYYPESVTLGGADHWPQPQRTGQTHVSVNTPPVYVDIPAALQAIPPVENYIAESPEENDRDKAGRRERLYFKWKDEDEFELEVHKACVTKALYGFTFAKIYWNAIEDRPTVRIIESPENLYVGWGASDYSRLDFAIYCYGLSPQSVVEEYGLQVHSIAGPGGEFYPYVTGTHEDPIGNVYRDETLSARPRSSYENLQVEVYDYWYKKPGKRTTRNKSPRPEIWNCIYVGNALVKNERHREYDDIPYLVLANTFIPKSPYGRPELYDLEQLFRETDERVTGAASVLQQVTGGQMWQLVGPNAEVGQVPDNLTPKPNKVISPGEGAEIRAIQPFMPQYAVADFLKIVDDYKEEVSGLNEFLRGKAPAQALGSSRVMTALAHQYGARILMRRDILYSWRKRLWRMVAGVWEAMDDDIAELLDGNWRLDVKAPDISPRDFLETAQTAINLQQNKIWSTERAMDATGVEDPGEEKTIIREEQTDPALNPDAVTKQATLAQQFEALGLIQPPGLRAPAQAAGRQLQAGPAGTSSLNAPENQANPPQDQLPANAQAGPQGVGPSKVQAQTMVQGEDVSSRVLTSTPL